MLRPYREALLTSDEVVLRIVRAHPLTFIGAALRGAFLFGFTLAAAFVVEQTTLLPDLLVPIRFYITIVLLLIGLIAALSALAAWARWRSTEVIVTDRRVIRVSGVFSKDVVDYSIDAITDLRLRQSWFGRLLGHGNVELLTASETTGHPRDTFVAIEQPIAFVHAVQAARERRRTRDHQPWRGADPDETSRLPLVR